MRRRHQAARPLLSSLSVFEYCLPLWCLEGGSGSGTLSTRTSGGATPARGAPLRDRGGTENGAAWLAPPPKPVNPSRPEMTHTRPSVPSQ